MRVALAPGLNSRGMPGARTAQPSVASGAGRALGWALLATLVMAAPVIVAPRERIFGSRDTFALADPNRDPLVVIEQFRTGQVPAPYLQPLTDVPGRLLARLMGPVAAYNVLVLGSFPLAAVAAYLLGRHLLGSHHGALVAGLAYAFLPFHVAHAAQHPHVAQTQWLPLYFLALFRCLEQPHFTRATLLLAAAAAVALSNFYAGLIAAVLSPVALAAYAIAAPRGAGLQRLRRLTLTGLILAVAAALALSMVYRLAPEVMAGPARFGFPRSDLFLHSAKWWSHLVPALDHPLAGPWVRQFWSARGVEDRLLEQQLGVGLGLALLGAVSLWLWLRGDRSTLAVRSAPVLASVAVAALLCSLAPERRIGPLLFVRPSAWLYAVAPMFRAYARFGLVVGLMTALLAGAGANCLWRRATLASRRTAALLLALAILEFLPLPPWRWRDVLPTRAHRWLAAQPGPLQVLDCVPPTRVSDVLAASLLGHPVALLGTSIDDCDEPRIADKLKALGYTHALVRRDSPSGRRRVTAGPPAGLSRAAEFDDAWVLVVEPGPPAAYVSAWTGFSPREYGPSAHWRWMGQAGTLRFAAPPGSGATLLELELRAFPSARRVSWSIDGRQRGELGVTPGWRRHLLPIGLLAAGDSTLTLACSEPAVVASDVLPGGDPRTLCLAVAQWRLVGSLPPAL